MALIREISIVVGIVIALVIWKEAFMVRQERSSINQFSMSPTTKRSWENILPFTLPLNDFPFSLWCSLKSFFSWWDLDLCFRLAPYGWRVFVWISSTFIEKKGKVFLLFLWWGKNNYCFFLSSFGMGKVSLDFMFCPLFLHKHRFSQCLITESLEKPLKATARQ